MKRQKTHTPSAKDITRKWYLLDAKGKTLGRLATVAANILRGKGKTFFAPHIDCGDFIVVINAKHVALTGKKGVAKQYFSHSGFPGGAKSISLDMMMEKHPERVVFNAVEGMLPRNKLSDRIVTKLKVYPGDKHPHSAQKPEELKL